MTIPEDIRAYIKKKNRKPIIKCIITMLVLAVFLILCDESFHYIPTVAKIISYIVILLIPVFAYRLPKIVFDRSWQGTIVKIFTDDEPYSPYKGYPATLHPSKTLIAFAVVKLENGELKTVKLHHGKYNNHFVKMIERYEIGDKIIHIKGTDVDQIIAHDSINCVVCGHVNKLGESVCDECGYSLDLE